MRSTLSALTIALVSTALLVAALPVVAQEPGYDQFERPAPQPPVEGFTRGDGTLILKDTDFCSYLLGSLWGEQQLTFTSLIDRSKKQKKARKAAFQPLTDVAVLERCADILNAFRLQSLDGDSLAPWARSGPVVPESLANLLPADFLTDPLAEPEPVGDGTRTSGYGAVLSSPLGLTGGTYFVEVNARACESWSGVLRGARDSLVDLGTIDGHAYLYDVPPANYYWDVDAPDCDWSVDLVTVDLGPEPTPTPLSKATVPKLFGVDWDRNVGATNPEWMPAAAARQALHDAGLTTGSCTLQVKSETTRVWPGRVWQQDPPPGAQVEIGTPVNVWIGERDCDIFTGDRIELE